MMARGGLPFQILIKKKIEFQLPRDTEAGHIYIKLYLITPKFLKIEYIYNQNALDFRNMQMTF